MAVMPAPQEILNLVERFNRNREEYKSGKYNETQLRQEFLNPFFKALGWDVTNDPPERLVDKAKLPKGERHGPSHRAIFFCRAGSTDGACSSCPVSSR